MTQIPALRSFELSWVFDHIRFQSLCPLTSCLLEVSIDLTALPFLHLKPHHLSWMECFLSSKNLSIKEIIVFLHTQDVVYAFFLPQRFILFW